MFDAKDIVMETVSNWGPGYEISFEMFVHSYGVGNSYGYSWVFVVANQEASSIGYGQPAIWLHKNGHLAIYHYLSEDEYDRHVELPVPLKTWIKVNIKSHQDNAVRINRLDYVHRLDRYLAFMIPRDPPE